jgi:WD40 repeat protein
VAVLPDGRLVATGLIDGQVLMWDTAELRDPTELGRHGNGVNAAALLPDGRVVTGGRDGRLLAWKPNALGTNPAELGRRDSAVEAMAVLGPPRPDARDTASSSRPLA